MFIWTYFDKAQAYWQSSHLEWWWRESRKREMWRFLTYSLLHSSWWHLTFNLVVQVIHQTFKLFQWICQTYLFSLSKCHIHSDHPCVRFASKLSLFNVATYIVGVDQCDLSFHVVKLWNCQLSNWSDFHSSIRTFNLVVIMIQLSFFFIFRMKLIMKQFNLDSFVPVMRNLMTTRQDSGCHWRWSTAVGGSPPSTYRGYPIDPEQLLNMTTISTMTLQWWQLTLGVTRV